MGVVKQREWRVAGGQHKKFISHHYFVGGVSSIMHTKHFFTTLVNRRILLVPQVSIDTKRNVDVR